MAKGLAVQQAIFTAAKTDRSADYRIVAASPGIAEIDRRELAAWGPGQDSLLDMGPHAVSVNFFPLPSGSYCVSRTAPMDWATRGGSHRVYTHCLVASPEVLRHYANHPLMLFAAALPAGSQVTLDKISARLETLELPEAKTAGETGRLAQLASEIGSASLALLVQAALSNVCLAVRGPVDTVRLIGGLIDCLPVECRTSISFSTGLKFSTRQAFDLIALPENAAQQRWLAHRPGLAALDLCRTPASAKLLVNAWARLIHRALSAGRFAFLSEELAKSRADFALADLSLLGLQLLDEFEGVVIEKPEGATTRRDHAAHCQFQQSTAAVMKSEASVICAPSEILDADSPEVVSRLEALDDVVFDAIQGKADALAALQALWPLLKIELGDALLAESREQYIRYAISIWQEPTNIKGDRDPARAVHALDVLCVLFDEVK